MPCFGSFDAAGQSNLHRAATLSKSYKTDSGVRFANQHSLPKPLSPDPPRHLGPGAVLTVTRAQRATHQSEWPSMSGLHHLFPGLSPVCLSPNQTLTPLPPPPPSCPLRRSCPKRPKRAERRRPPLPTPPTAAVRRAPQPQGLLLSAVLARRSRRNPRPCRPAGAGEAQSSSMPRSSHTATSSGCFSFVLPMYMRSTCTRGELR